KILMKSDQLQTKAPTKISQNLSSRNSLSRRKRNRNQPSTNHNSLSPRNRNQPSKNRNSLSRRNRNQPSNSHQHLSRLKPPQVMATPTVHRLTPELQPIKVNEMKTHMKSTHHIHWAVHPPLTSTTRHSAR